jgi:hypothetical protein
VLLAQKRRFWIVVNMSHFQVELGGRWQEYSKEEDKILKRAYMAGFRQAKFHLRGQNYVYDFKNMMQTNTSTGKSRKIRAPHKWKAPKAPIVPQGPTTVVNVPPGAPGSVIQVPYPGVPGKLIAVNVPASAKPGQAMLVPVPPVDQAIDASGGGGATGGGGAPPAAAPEKSGGWSTGAKVAATGAAVVGVGGAAVGGAILGAHIAEHGMDATVDAAGDGIVDAGEAIGEFAVDAGEFIVDAGEGVGDFIMDLF